MTLTQKILAPFPPMIIGLVFFTSFSYNQSVRDSVFSETFLRTIDDVQRNLHEHIQPSDLTKFSDPQATERLRSFVEEVTAPSTARVTVWNRDKVVAFSDLHPIIGIRSPHHPDLERVFTQQQAFYLRKGEDTNYPVQSKVGEFLDIYIPIRDATEIIGAVEVQSLTQAIIKPVSKAIRRTRLIHALVSTFTLVLGYLLLRYFIIRPIQRLQGATQAIVRGDFSTRLPSRYHDEIGALSKNFEHMRTTLRSTLDHFHEQRDLALAIVNSTGEGLIVIDREFRIVLINPIAQELLEVSGAEAYGKEYRTLMHVIKDGEEVPLEERPIVKAITIGKSFAASLTDNFSFTTKSGKKFPVIGAITPLKGNHVSGAVVVFRDVTELKKLEEARSSFISIASHQLRTPITPIRWFSEMLLQGDVGPLSSEQREIVERMNLGTIQMISTLNLLLQIAHVESGRVRFEPKPLDLKSLVEEVVRSIDVFLAHKQHKVVVNVNPDPLPTVSMDRDVLWQVLVNLLTNASTYSLQHSTIEVHITLGGDHYQVAIQDHGIGIPKNQQHRIFEKFFRADNAQRAAPQGNGLGLSLVKSLVEGWEGKVWFESKEGKGTTFYVSIPKAGMKPKAGEVKLSV